MGGLRDDKPPSLAKDCCTITNSVTTTAAPSVEYKLTVDYGDRQTVRQTEDTYVIIII